MITGAVQFGEARIQLSVTGTRGRNRQVDVVIDTGFTASLTLPPSLIAALGLRWQSVGRGTLADGSTCLFDVYEAKIGWDRRVLRVLVSEADTDPLVGMELLNGYELTVQVRNRGRVTIRRLSKSKK